MSALPPKADIPQRRLDVRFVPKADPCTAAKSASFGAICRASSLESSSARSLASSLAVRLQPAVGGKEFVPHAHDCIGRFFKIDVFGGRCLRNNTSSCLKCIALKAAGLESRH